MWNRTIVGDLAKGAEDRLVEQHILTQSTLFIGHTCSSFAFHVALWREQQGMDRQTNVIAGYRETGYMHHFFNRQ
jgi:hypothetical protein